MVKILNLKLILSLMALVFLVGCFPTSEEEPEVPVFPNSGDTGIPASQDLITSSIPVVSQPTVGSQPTTISQPTTVSSSIQISSSEEVFVPTCERRTPDLEFRFVTGDSMVAGWQPGTYEIGKLSVGSLIVPSGDPCEDAQEVAAKMPGDEYNLFLKSAWRGRSGEVLKLDVITWTGNPNGNVSSSTNSSNGSTAIPGAVAGWLTEDLYNDAFPKRDPFYTWAAFVQAFEELQNITQLGDFKNFLKEGTLDAKKREAAAFFANIVQETGSRHPETGLHHIVETCAADGTPTGRCTGYGSFDPNYYYGRGPMQLSWNYNYQNFSQAIFNNPSTLLNNPNLVSTDAKVAWLAAMWFWNRVDTSYFSPPPTLHDIMINGASWQGVSGFGGTIKLINGGLECSSPDHPQANSRGYYFKHMQTILDIPQDTSNLTCI